MNRMESNNTKWILIATAALLALSSSAWANTVRLKRSAVVEPDQMVRLIDVAELEGVYASSLARTVIAPEASKVLGAQGTCEITLDRVRAALHEQDAVMGRLSFSGRSCVLRSTVSTEAEPEAEEVKTVELPWRTVEDWQQATEATVEIGIVRAFARDLKVEPHRLRLRFPDAPADLLDLSVGSQRTVIRPISSFTSAVVLMKVERYKSSGSLDRVETIKVEAQVLRPVLKLREQVSRRDAITGGVLEASEEWLAAAVDAIQATEAYDYVGQIATTRLMPGEILLRSQVEKPIAVERNAVVMVIYHGNGFMLESQGKAREAGRVGEIIEIRLTDSDKSVLARVDGPQRVIVVTR